MLAELELGVLEYLQALYEEKDLSGPQAIIGQRKAEISAAEAESFEEWLSIITNIAYLLKWRAENIEKIHWKGVGVLDPSDLQTIIDDCRRVILGFCSLRLPDFSMGPSGHHSFIGKLIARDPALGRLHIFTTNYDTLIEQALDDLRVQYFDGFSGKVRPAFDPSVYGIDVYYPGDVAEGRVRRYDKFALLSKLHGSVSWRVDEGRRELVQLHPNLAQIKDWRESTQAPTARHEKLEQIDRELGFPISILPTSEKMVQTLELPYAHLFRLFGARLAQPQSFLMVIGYGFGDAHINKLIDDAMSNPGLVMLVVDPFPGDATKQAIARYQQIGERAFLLEGAVFDTFASELMPHVRWLDDFARLRSFEKLVAESEKMTRAESGTDKA